MARGKVEEPASAEGPEARQGGRLRRLLAELAEGDPSVLAPLYDLLAGEVYGIALWSAGSAADAADVTQEVFVRLAGAGRRLREVRDPRAYVRRMAHRAAVDLHRLRGRRREEPLDRRALVVAVSGRPEETADLNRALARLPSKQREAIYLRVFAGCSFAEAARAMGVPTFTAASRYRRGLARLRAALGGK